MVGHAVEDFHCLGSVGSRGISGVDLDDKHDSGNRFVSVILCFLVQFFMGIGMEGEVVDVKFSLIEPINGQ